MKIKYLLLSYVGEDCKHARYFESDMDNLDINPYQDDCPIVVSSNQTVVKEEDATAYQLSLAEMDKKQKTDNPCILKRTVLI